MSDDPSSPCTTHSLCHVVTMAPSITTMNHQMVHEREEEEEHQQGQERGGGASSSSSSLSLSSSSSSSSSLSSTTVTSSSTVSSSSGRQSWSDVQVTGLIEGLLREMKLTPYDQGTLPGDEHAHHESDQPPHHHHQQEEQQEHHEHCTTSLQSTHRKHDATTTTIAPSASSASSPTPRTPNFARLASCVPRKEQAAVRGFFYRTVRSACTALNASSTGSNSTNANTTNTTTTTTTTSSSNCSSGSSGNSGRVRQSSGAALFDQRRLAWCYLVLQRRAKDFPKTKRIHRQFGEVLREYYRTGYVALGLRREKERDNA